MDVRLEELNILLKQTVMIRRLKKHVLVQLPPKRRQIISLQLKKTHVISALSKVRSDEEYKDLKYNSEEEPSEISDEPNDSNSCSRSTRMLSEKEVGVAKLYGFFEWLSMHPIFGDLDDADNLNFSISTPKMIIFAHHHKVRDGVEEFICDKGIGFVCIDGSTLPQDRQSAVTSFQSSKEIKVALIGIRAACFHQQIRLCSWSCLRTHLICVRFIYMFLCLVSFTLNCFLVVKMPISLHKVIMLVCILIHLELFQ